MNLNLTIHEHDPITYFANSTCNVKSNYMGYILDVFAYVLFKRKLVIENLSKIICTLKKKKKKEKLALHNIFVICD